jgi:hypothetical protein
MIYHGSPHIFFTLNPADHTSPIASLLAGKSVEQVHEMSWWQRAVLIAKNPVASAQFFQTIVRAFLKTLIKPGVEEGGVFGGVDSYYGTIECQGRGSLHLHMLIWLRDCPHPDDLFLRLEDDEYRQRFFAYLEGIFRQDIPDQRTECVPNNYGSTHLERQHITQMESLGWNDHAEVLTNLRQHAGDIHKAYRALLIRRSPELALADEIAMLPPQLPNIEHHQQRVELFQKVANDTAPVVIGKTKKRSIVPSSSVIHIFAHWLTNVC